MPAGTKNAIGMLVRYLRDNDLLAEVEKPYFELLATIHGSTDGSTLGIAATDDVFEPLTCIGGTIHMQDGRISQTVDSRYPKSITGEEITERLSELAGRFGATLENASATVPFFIDPDSECVKVLIDCYNEFTGKNAKPFTIGGGTYARHFKNAVSFGPEEPSEPTPDWVGIMHGPDEGVSEELMRRSLKIYIMAIDKLMGVKF